MPSGIIALLTDFGTADHFAGSMKGVILSIDPNAAVVDITHEIPPQDIDAAAFALLACHKDFPPDTVFVAVADPGVGSERRAIVAQTAGRYFVAPDNGILSYVLSDDAPVVVHQITNDTYFRHPVSRTFHGREIFAPAAAHLSKGVRPDEFGPIIINPVRLPPIGPVLKADGTITASIIHIDRFGNLVTGLSREDLPPKFAITCGGMSIEKLVDFYSEAQPGEVFAIEGSTGFVELCAFRHSAAQILNAKRGDLITAETRV